jgi:D-alanyl-D-alanine carboxypeptidase/D-alanyl-D-alanine-endopeptidase (penicillin-binding protein 4)
MGPVRVLPPIFAATAPILAALTLGLAVAPAASTAGERYGGGYATHGPWPSFAPDTAGSSSPAPSRGRAERRRGGISRGRLRRKLAKIAAQAPGASGYYVYDIGAKKRKRVLFDRKEGKRRKLASNEKLFTTATALHRLGPKSRILTRVKRRGNVSRRGRLKGDLFLIGGGDPSLGKGGVRALARDVRRAGIKRVSGTVVADDSVFDRRRGVPGTGYRPTIDIPPLSGLVYGGSTYSGDPAKAAAKAFRSALRHTGVRIGGKVRVGTLPGKLRDSPALGEFASPTIRSLVAATNKPSNNFFAEMLLKRLWAEPGRKGTTAGGARAVERYARKLGSRVRALDGSGLTDRNLASPRDIVRLLTATLRNRRIGDPFYDSLAKAGKEGTLDDRMEGTPAAGRCRGKTGTISSVSNLSGFCRSGHGKVAFSILMNGVGFDYDRARDLQDRMVVEIARFR